MAGLRRTNREARYRKLPRWLQTAAVNWEGYRNRAIRLGPEFRDELALLERSERYSATELEALQSERLQRLIATAYAHVPYYREMFDRSGLNPDDVTTAGDLEKLPVLEKSDVISAGEAMVNQSLSPSERIGGHTSGSTGTAIALTYDRAALAAEFATVWRLRRRFGCDLDRWHGTFAGRLVVPHEQQRPPYHRINYAQKQMLFSLYHLKPDTVSAYADALASRELEFYSGYPSALQALTVAGSQAGGRIPGPQKAIFPSSESLLAWQREQLARDYGVPVYDRYGCAEFCVSFTVCPEGRYHLDSEFAIVELEKLAESEESITGALICTGLMNHAMPFIRYRVGDVATVAKTSCPCGRASLSAYEIDGRVEDFVLTKSGVRLGRLDHLFKDMHQIRESQIVQDEPGRMTITIVRAPEYGVNDEKRLLAECASRLGGDMEIELAYATEIPRNAAGKFRAVVNKIDEARRYAH